MCAIVGLLAKTPELRAQLGALATPMLTSMSARGPDSAGLALFTPALPGARRKLSVYSGPVPGGAQYDWCALGAALDAALPGAAATVQASGNHGVLAFDADAQAVKDWLRAQAPQLQVLASGQSMDLYKDTGTPAEVAQRYRFSALSGSHLVGHTRMATESAVTPERAHPFSAGQDFCLVHNGSLSNANGIRRMLAPHAIGFETDNDTEAATRFIEWRLRCGDSLADALKHSLQVLDGFYTLLIGTADELALLRDPFACKPALVAQTADYVAIASEFRALAHLPGIDGAQVFEPAPRELYLWKV